MELHSSLEYLADWNRVSSRIAWHLGPSIFPQNSPLMKNICTTQHYHYHVSLFSTAFFRWWNGFHFFHVWFPTNAGQKVYILPHQIRRTFSTCWLNLQGAFLQSGTHMAHHSSIKPSFVAYPGYSCPVNFSHLSRPSLQLLQSHPWPLVSLTNALSLSFARWPPLSRVPNVLCSFQFLALVLPRMFKLWNIFYNQTLFDTFLSFFFRTSQTLLSSLCSLFRCVP